MAYRLHTYTETTTCMHRADYAKFCEINYLLSLYMMLIGAQVSHCGCPCGDHQPWGGDPGESRVCGKATDKDVSEE